MLYRVYHYTILDISCKWATADGDRIHCNFNRGILSIHRLILLGIDYFSALTDKWEPLAVIDGRAKLKEAIGGDLSVAEYIRRQQSPTRQDIIKCYESL